MTELAMPGWIAIPAGLLLICGGLFSLVGAAGLLRFRDFFARMHPATMATTLGTGCVLISSMLVSSALLDRPAVHELVITVFIVVTAPVSAITLMRAAISRSQAKTNHRPD
jgi:multicomponent K+:H+ antiporter subunit G